MLEPMPVDPGGASRKVEITTILIIGAALLALVSLHSDAAGAIGTRLADILRYLFGQLASIPPVLAALIAILFIRDVKRPHLARKLWAIALLFLAVMLGWHLVAGDLLPIRWAALVEWSPDQRGAGVLGGLIAYILHSAFGTVGAAVVVGILALIAIVLYLDSPLSRAVRQGGEVSVRVVSKVVRAVVGFITGARDDAREVWASLRDRWVLFRERRAVPRTERVADKPPAKAKEEGEKVSPFARLRAFIPRLRRKPKRDWAIDRPQLKRGAKRDVEEASSAMVPQPQVEKVTESASEASAPAAVVVAEERDDMDEAQLPAPVHSSRALTAATAVAVEDEEDETLAPEEHVEAVPAVSSGVEPAPSVEVVDEPAEEQDVDDEESEPTPFYRLPPTALLERPRHSRNGNRESTNGLQSQLLEETLSSFGIDAKVVEVNQGPVVTRYEVQPPPGIKVNRITGLADDIALALAAAGIRIEAPVPGKSVVGIEVPNRETTTVHLREVIESDEFQKASSRLMLALGKDIAGNPVVADMRKLLHVLIAGSTGSGKSVCINTIIASILYKALPHEVKLLMIDPKRVELAVYDGIPHLVSPVVTDPKQASAALKWAVKEMENRYNRFSEVGARNIDGYNRYVEALLEEEADADPEERAKLPRPMPYIVIIIDELADLMMVAQGDVEDSISRLAQMARAAGIHLIIATQRPSVDVITGLIKANVPSRIAFAVASNHDSRTILDMVGAERLIGRGDMLFYPTGANKPWRAQGAFISDREVQDLVEFWKQQGEPQYREEVITQGTTVGDTDVADDELFEDAVRLVIDTQNASISMLQRRFRIGYSRAARLIDIMEQKGIVGPYQGSKPREVLWTHSEDE